MGVPRVTGIAIDPTNGNSVWVGIEVDGLRHSADGGDTWETIDHHAIPNMDIHNVTVTAGPPHRVVVMVNDDVFLSDDDGGSWRNLDVRAELPAGATPAVSRSRPTTRRPFTRPSATQPPVPLA